MSAPNSLHPTPEKAWASDLVRATSSTSALSDRSVGDALGEVRMNDHSVLTILKQGCALCFSRCMQMRHVAVLEGDQHWTLHTAFHSREACNPGATVGSSCIELLLTSNVRTYRRRRCGRTRNAPTMSWWFGASSSCTRTALRRSMTTSATVRTRRLESHLRV